MCWLPVMRINCWEPYICSNFQTSLWITPASAIILHFHCEIGTLKPKVPIGKCRNSEAANLTANLPSKRNRLATWLTCLQCVFLRSFAVTGTWSHSRQLLVTAGNSWSLLATPGHVTPLTCPPSAWPGRLALGRGRRGGWGRRRRARCPTRTRRGRTCARRRRGRPWWE